MIRPLNMIENLFSNSWRGPGSKEFEFSMKLLLPKTNGLSRFYVGKTYR
jgi:hypothetical protein